MNISILIFFFDLIVVDVNVSIILRGDVRKVQRNFTNSIHVFFYNIALLFINEGNFRGIIC